jgi:hypothetical protein
VRLKVSWHSGTSWTGKDFDVKKSAGRIAEKLPAKASTITDRDQCAPSPGFAHSLHILSRHCASVQHRNPGAGFVRYLGFLS